MLLNRRMETALENLYKQGKVVGGVYFGLGQEGCSCASAYALQQGRLAGADDPQPGRAAGARLLAARHHDAVHGQGWLAHLGQATPVRTLAISTSATWCAPISTLGDLIPVLAGVALGARLQGRDIAAMTYIGDGGQSTGVTYEGLELRRRAEASGWC